MATSVITFDALYEFFRKEKYSSEIQPLPETFYNDVVKYLEEKSAILESQKHNDATFAGESKKTEVKLGNIKNILRELYEKREQKIMQLAMLTSRISEKHDLSMMLKEEKELFEKALKMLNIHRKGILHNILESKLPSIPVEEPPQPLKTENQVPRENITIRFIQDVPRFVDSDLTTYGPFEKEDVASIPNKLAVILMRNAKAEEIR